jgi:hypothetical protein
MALLEHPSLIADKNTNPPPQSSLLRTCSDDINIEGDLAGSVLDKIIRERGKSEGAKKAAEKRKLTSDSIAQNILKSQRLTSGVMTQNSTHSLNNPRFLEPFCLCLIESTKKEAEKKSKRKALNSKLVSAVKELRAKWGHETTHSFQQCDKNECRAYLQYKKQPKDKAMPKDLLGRRQRCVEWIGRPSPNSSPYQSDEEENYDVLGIQYFGTYFREETFSCFLPRVSILPFQPPIILSRNIAISSGKYEARIAIFRIFAAVDRFSRISRKAESR